MLGMRGLDVEPFAPAEAFWFLTVPFVTISGLRWGWCMNVELGIALLLPEGRMGDGEETA